jgi:glycosyltransferase involved in cell wall biosynthesis
MTDERPQLSVVIPTYRDAPCLELTLRSLTRQTLPDTAFEVVVVRDGDGPGYDGTADAGKPLDLRVLTLVERRGRAAARNAGVRQARGPVVLFLDSDSYAEPDLLARHHAAHRAGGPDRVVLGTRYEIGWPHLGFLLREEPVPAELLSTVDCRDLRFPADLDDASMRELMRTPWLFAYTHNVSVPRALLDAVGGFDEEFGVRWGWEDLDLFYRVYLHLGRDEEAFRFDRGAVCYHQPQFRDFDAWYRDYTENATLAKRRFPHLDWEFTGRWIPVEAAAKIRYYRAALDDCARSGSGRLTEVWDAVADRLGAGPVLGVGTDTALVALPAGSVTFDHGRPATDTNLHLVGTAIPSPDDVFDAVVNVDIWRCLPWGDLCAFVTESLRVAGRLLLVSTRSAVQGRPAPGPDELAHMARTLAPHLDVSLVHDGHPAMLELRR